jgi:hypothetical protein
MKKVPKIPDQLGLYGDLSKFWCKLAFNQSTYVVVTVPVMTTTTATRTKPLIPKKFGTCHDCQKVKMLVIITTDVM